MKEIFSLSSKKKQPSPPLSKQPTPPRKEHSSKPSDATIGVQQIDIATRRRLSTPKASPLPKRNLSQKSSKISHSSDVSKEAPPKTSWFKSLERLSRKKVRFFLLFFFQSECLMILKYFRNQNVWSLVVRAKKTNNKKVEYDTQSTNISARSVTITRSETIAQRKIAVFRRH